ncbi:hypothetical protein E4U55_005047 [Claviceps digitariae]|nr:hypothetical protein E4U55_005047 [Claviceps digitariae]
MKLPILTLTLALVVPAALAQQQPLSLSLSLSTSLSAVPTAPPLHSFPPISGASRVPEGIEPTTTGPTTTGSASSETGTATSAATSTSTGWAVPTGQARVVPVLGVVAAVLML